MRKFLRQLLKKFVPEFILEQRSMEALRKIHKIPIDVYFTKDLKIFGDFECGEGCRFFGNIVFSGSTKVGRFTSINGPNTDVISRVNPIIIGSFCSIARNVSFQEYSHHISKPSSSFINKNILGGTIEMDIESKGTIEIGNDVWIGTQSIILSGVKVGNGAIIAANSVVNSNVPPYAIVAGSPAKVIKYRFNKDNIERLQNLEWWNWTKEKLKENKEFFNQTLH